MVVSGATGSGKTTQVPAFVLEDAIIGGIGGTTSIICTQPRRISAIGVAGRVAQERSEKAGENMVGYAIRGERKASSKCKLLFCTTGIREVAPFFSFLFILAVNRDSRSKLRWFIVIVLQRISRGGDPDLEGVSHVFVDEVHERSLDSDFLLLILKELLERNKHIKVILVSLQCSSLTAG